MDSAFSEYDLCLAFVIMVINHDLRRHSSVYEDASHLGSYAVLTGKYCIYQFATECSAAIFRGKQSEESALWTPLPWR
jgi:hypothetical protein